jgi:hypothetical protein
MDFTLEVFQNEYVGPGATTMDAILTVTGKGAAAPVPGESAAEVLIIDTSGSMGTPPGRIMAARQAAAEAIDTVHDGVLFAVVAGTDRAHPIFPTWGPGLAVADPSTRIAAKEALRYLKAGGGTAMSTWLMAARELFAGSPTAKRHAILLTDGDNWEDPWLLDEALRACQGHFQVDCRGVGTDWVVGELRTIASALMGTVDIIPEPEQMADEFRTLMGASMNRAVAAAELQVWCPRGASVDFVRQVAPEVDDLSARGSRLDERTTSFALGSWGAEARDFHLSVSIPPNDVGVELLAARVALVADGEVVAKAPVRTVWTDDDAVSGRINREVAHYTGQAELSASIQEGLDALKRGDEETATTKFGRATQLAAESGHDGTVRLLRKVVDVEDERTGTVRIRRNVAKVDEMALDTRSTRTVRVRTPKAEPMALDTRSTVTVRVPPGSKRAPTDPNAS